MKVVFYIVPFVCLVLGSVCFSFDNIVKENSMKTVFSDKIEAVENEYEVMASRMESISRSLQVAMGLTEKQVETAAHHGISWDVGDYKIVPGIRCLPNGWKEVLQIVPLSTGSKFGYSNTQDPLIDIDWYYVNKGTATVIVPPDGVVKSVLQSIRNM